VEALRRLEEERDVGGLVEIHTEDFSKSSRSLLMSVEPVRHQRWFLVRG